jgi:hypothetical protein
MLTVSFSAFSSFQSFCPVPVLELKKVWYYLTVSVTIVVFRSAVQVLWPSFMRVSLNYVNMGSSAKIVLTMQNNFEFS